MKKLFAMMMAVMMVVSMFAACGGESGGDVSEKGDAIRIGMSAPLTGDNAVYGNAVKWGMEVAVEEINAKGGVQIQFMAEDDVSDNEKAVNAYATLMDEGMQILAGAVTTGPCLAIAPKTVADNVFMMTPSGSNEDIPKVGDNVFQMCFTDPNQGAASAELINSQKLGTKIGILYDSTTDYSNGIKKSFEAAAAELNMEVAAVSSFDANTTDYKTQLQQLQSADCDLVFMPIYAAQAVTVLTNANEMDYKPVFLGCDGMDGVLTQENFDVSLAEGLIMMTPYAADNADPANVAFVEKYKAKSGGEAPNQFAADGYDVIYAVYEGCVAKGITGKTSNADACAALKEYFATATFNGLTGQNMTWDETGMVSKVPAAVEIQDGKYVSK